MENLGKQFIQLMVLKFGVKPQILDKIFLIQKNDVHIITFAEFNAHTDPIFKKLKILKIKDHYPYKTVFCYTTSSIKNCPGLLIILSRN